jgi:hypothetical protein
MAKYRPPTDEDTNRNTMLRYAIILRIFCFNNEWERPSAVTLDSGRSKLSIMNCSRRSEAATRAGGATAEASKRVMAVLKPHFEKEEKFALPQLGVLRYQQPRRDHFARNEKDLIARTERFRLNCPQCWEHNR